jgi:hypothetical protein
MNCTVIGTQLGFTCKPVSDSVFYLESPISLAFDGNLIGAYVQNMGNGSFRISDNADTLFSAMTHGVRPTAAKGRKLAELVAMSGLDLSDDGEIFKACSEDQLPFYLARFIEAAEHVGFACNKLRPSPVSRFDRVIETVLRSAYPSQLKTDFYIIGASGHQLTLPFALVDDSRETTLIQTIPTKNGKVDWSLVYRAVGKMLDIKNAHSDAHRAVILEPGDEGESRKAATALADAAEVLIYTGTDHLISALAA